MPGLDDFKNLRRIRFFNRILQVAFSLTLVAGLNFLAARYYHRVDLTVDQQFSLSPETMAYLKRMREPVQVFITYTPEANQDFFNFVKTLLTTYESNSRRQGEAMIQVEYIDLYQQQRRAQELVNLYDIQEENSIVVASGNRQVVIDRTELFEMSQGEITGFRGEEIFTSAILEVSNPEKPRIYFTIGHGEKRLNNVDPRLGLSALADYLEDKNFELTPIDLTQTPEIPEDASLLVIAGQQSALLPQEVEKLRSYLSEQNGRLLILLDPFREHGMEDLFFEWGILAENLLVIDRDPNAVAAGGDLVIRRFVEHPVTQFLIDYRLFTLWGSTRSVRPDPGAPLDERLTVTPLLASSDLSWAERTPSANDPASFDPKVDIQGPVPVAVAAERRVGESLGIELAGGRIVAFGNSDFVTNNRMEAFGNRILFLNTIKWLTDRDASLNIESRKVTTYRLVLADGDLRKLLLYYMAVPGGIGILGFLLLFLRKR